jgi:hypothetical protein
MGTVPLFLSGTRNSSHYPEILNLFEQDFSFLCKMKDIDYLVEGEKNGGN